MPRYNPNEIEPRWQQYWDEHHTFATPEMPQGEKLYVLDMFPYPSGSGLHVGHPEGYTATDITCRFERMRGRSVLHPMGFDSFGLPAEEHAIKTNTHPRLQTEKNIETFRGQLKRLGFSYDWNRELATTDTDYFRWTQWIFLELFDTWFDHEQQKGRPIAELPIPPAVAAEGDEAVRRYQDEHRLAYQNYAPVNWCPTLGTVLANEEVIDGRSEVGGHPVERLPLRQWMLRITAYGDRLEKDLETLGWPDHVKALQRNWIGRSTGAEVDFFIGTGESHTPEKAALADWETARRSGGFPEKPGGEVLRVYTTRPDTLFGATYMVIAPEHSLVELLTTAAQAQAVDNYCRKATGKSDLERTELAKEKTGVFTGSYALNPVNGEPVPIWIADYVLATYGTGAIMAVPAHDERDFEFAKAYDIPVIPVVDPPDSAQTAELDYNALLAGDACFVGEGKAINSGEYNDLTTAEFKHRITEQLVAAGTGKAAVNYKLRDWLFSRQRFWGEPFPLLHEVDENGEPTGLMRPVPVEQLPVDLPQVEDYKPHGRPDPLLEKAPEDWLYVELDGKRYKRETNTMPQWAGSCWYYLRFIDPKNSTAFVDPAKEQAWMPVDLYVGGVEHAVLHLLYARFWHKVLYDRGHVSTIEPFQKLVNQGMILGEMEFTGYQRENGDWVTASEIKRTTEGIDIAADGAPVNTVKLTPEDLTKKGERFVLTSDPKIAIDSRAHKMSKSRGNVINPDVVVKEYGADSLRLYEMFMGPLEATKPWSMAGVSGVRNFLDRAWRLVVDDRAEELALHPGFTEAAPSDDDLRVLHKTIKAVTADTAALSCNTAISRMMELVNHFTKQETRPRAILEPFVLMLSPYAPHLCEELWRLLGHEESLAYAAWPAFEEALTQDDTIEVPVQIKGKLRAKFTVPAGLSKDELEAAALADAKVQELLADQQVVKTIVVPGRLVNFVTR